MFRSFLMIFYLNNLNIFVLRKYYIHFKYNLVVTCLDWLIFCHPRVVLYTRLDYIINVVFAVTKIKSIVIYPSCYDLHLWGAHHDIIIGKPYLVKYFLMFPAIIRIWPGICKRLNPKNNPMCPPIIPTSPLKSIALEYTARNNIIVKNKISITHSQTFKYNLRYKLIPCL